MTKIVKVISKSDEEEFEKILNEHLYKGWKVRYESFRCIGNINGGTSGGASYFILIETDETNKPND